VRPVILGVLVIAGGTISTYVFNYMNTFAITTLHLAATIGTALTATGSVASIAGVAVGVWADRFGRKAVLVGSRAIFVAGTYPAFLAYASPGATPVAIIAINMLQNFLFAIGLGALYAFLAEIFPRSVRSSGLSILYAASVAIFGGTTQFVVAWLIDRLKSPLVPAWYQIVANVASMAALLLLAPHPEVLRERQGR
jgi:MFS family permease